MRRVKFPNDPAEVADFRKASIEYVLPGYAPPKALFQRSAKVVTAGSCFAENLSQSLTRIGVANTHLPLTEATNSATATAIQIDEILSGPPGPDRAAIEDADLVVITLGVGFGVFLNDEPVIYFDRKTLPHLKWRLLTCNEVTQYAGGIVDHIQAASRATVVFTLSPLPLNSSTFHPSVFAADCLSKSTIRLGLEELMTENRPGVFYWPSFEMVRWLTPHRERCFGTDGADNRHISPRMIDEVMSLFLETYFFD